jgi:glutamate-ammonia-ligase adenylyltransferase
VDVEFIAQALQLIAGASARDPVTRVALERLCAAGFLDAAETATLVRADRVYRMVQGLQRLTAGGATAPPPAAMGVLARAIAGRELDAGALVAILDVMATDVRAIFLRRIGPV